MDRVLIDSFEIKFNSALRNLKSAILIGAMLFALCILVWRSNRQRFRGLDTLLVDPLPLWSLAPKRFARDCATSVTSRGKT